MASNEKNTDSERKSARKAYSREFKLNVVTWFFNNGKKVNSTARNFKIDKKLVRMWVRAEQKIRNQKPRSKSSGRGRQPFSPSLEKDLHDEFKTMRREGKVVKRWWFNTRMIQLVKERNPEKADFKASDRWFSAFCRRYGVALRRKTHTVQKAPEQLRNTITKFHSKILCERKRGKYEDCDIANMYQTSLPFVLDDGKSYDSTGAKEVWCSNASSGLDKRQFTVQLTIFADGVSRVRPTIIFRGQGKRISPNEKRSWDGRVNVMFQPKAWCDENVMKVWVEREWGNMFTNPPRANSSGKILVADVHRAQQTDEVKQLLQRKKTLLINVPPGCTSRVQPLDVSVNKPLKTRSGLSLRNTSMTISLCTRKERYRRQSEGYF